MTHILVTRPDPGGSELCAYLAAHHYQPIYFPTIAFAPPHDLVALQAAVSVLGLQDWLIFISPRAVYASVPLIRRYWPECSDQVKFAAVGHGTAKALKHAGYQATVFPEADWRTEGLLALPAFQAVTAQKIMIIRGEGGRDALGPALSQRGAIITELLAYRRVMPKIDHSECLGLIQQQKINAIVCTSYEGVRHLQAMLGDEIKPMLQRIPLIVISERIKMLARDLGFQTIWVAKNASHAAMIEVIVQNGL